MVMMWFGSRRWPLRQLPRRHGPTDEGNRSGEGSELAEEVGGGALGCVFATGGGDVRELAGALVGMSQLFGCWFRTALTAGR
jgi:hypothetical protein